MGYYWNINGKQYCSDCGFHRDLDDNDIDECTRTEKDIVTVRRNERRCPNWGYHVQSPDIEHNRIQPDFNKIPISRLPDSHSDFIRRKLEVMVMPKYTGLYEVDGNFYGVNLKEYLYTILYHADGMITIIFKNKPIDDIEYRNPNDHPSLADIFSTTYPLHYRFNNDRWEYFGPNGDVWNDPLT